MTIMDRETEGPMLLGSKLERKASYGVYLYTAGPLFHCTILVITGSGLSPGGEVCREYLVYLFDLRHIIYYSSIVSRRLLL